MGFFKSSRRGRAACIGIASALAAIAVMPASASATGTASVQVTVTSTQANAGSIALTNVTDSTTYGTCQASATPGSNTCTISVPALSGVLLIAQPAAGEATGTWSGKCAGTPGPVCHIQSAANGKTTSATARLKRTSGPAVGASPVYLAGPTPNGCSAAESTTVSGTGFEPNTTATLSDDGNAVASSTTDASGSVSFSYTPASSEPGVYRTLTIAVGSRSAGTDVYNSGRFCITTTTTAPGMDTLTANVSGLDANSSDTYVQVAGQSPTVIDGDSTGAGSSTTPAFSCATGKTFTFRLYGQRGVGTLAHYSYIVADVKYSC